MKESKFYNRTQITNILLLPTSRNLLIRPRANSETTDSFFLGFSSKYKHTRLCFFKFLWQQLNDHQAPEEISFLIILSLCKGKLLQISQEIYINSNMSNTKTWLEFAFYTQDKLENPKHFKQLELSWKSAEKRILPEIRSIEPKLQSIEPGRNAK